MNSELTEKWHKTSALAGAAVWAGLAGMAGAGKAPLGVIELLFLFGVLVIVPLGIALGEVIIPVRQWHLIDIASIVQPFAAGLVVLSFWCTPGQMAGMLTLPWFLMCLVLGLAGCVSLFHNGGSKLNSWAVNIGRGDLIVSGGWLLISRMGWRIMGIQEPIALLTAVHFIYTGFATALIAGTLVTFHESRKLVNLVVTLVIAVPFLVATGFVWSPILKMMAAVVLAIAVTSLAFMQFGFAKIFSGFAARMFLRLSSSAVIAGMVLAGVYAIGDWLVRDWLPIPLMATTHGVLNGFGFVLLGLLGWLAGLSSKNIEHSSTKKSGESFRTRTTECETLLVRCQATQV
jgi:hypothetical protein